MSPLNQLLNNVVVFVKCGQGSKRYRSELLQACISIKGLYGSITHGSRMSLSTSSHYHPVEESKDCYYYYYCFLLIPRPTPVLPLPYLRPVASLLHRYWLFLLLMFLILSLLHLPLLLHVQISPAFSPTPVHLHLPAASNPPIMFHTFLLLLSQTLLPQLYLHHMFLIFLLLSPFTSLLCCYFSFCLWSCCLSLKYLLTIPTS